MLYVVCECTKQNQADFHNQFKVKRFKGQGNPLEHLVCTFRSSALGFN